MNTDTHAMPAGQAAGSPSAAEAGLRARLHAVRVGLRADLEVSRHVFRGQPAYIVRDPLTFQSQHLTAADYEILVRIDARRTLGQIFSACVAAGQLAAADEERFYGFILRLHSVGLLALPVSDDQQLYKRLQARRQAEARQRWLAAISFRCSLWDPDEFLDRTVRWVRPIFSRAAFVVWLLAVGGALLIATAQRRELWEPLNGVLAAGNLPLIWVTLILLKALHEFGHAYACKHFGGRVPDMGALFILGTPCAYVDAGAAWSFSRARERVIVSLAGMYVELFIAALATCVWAFAADGQLRDLAFNVMFLASGVTILFNVNPLMRFDGYFVFADWVQIPNLRARADAHLRALAARLLLGVDRPLAGATPRERTILTLYGLAALVYRVVLTLGIATIMAVKFGWLGLAGGGLFLAVTSGGWLRRTLGYLWVSPETRPCRGRAVLLSGGLLAAPALIALAPAGFGVCAPGVIGREHEVVLRTPSAALMEEIRVRPGDPVAAGASLAQLAPDAIDEMLVGATADLAAARTRLDAFRASDPGQARRESQNVALLESRLARLRSERAALELTAPLAGEVVASLSRSDAGRFLEAGAPVATIAAGAWRVRVELNDDQLAAARPHPGDPVTIRTSAGPGETHAGVVERVTPAGSNAVRDAVLTQHGGGEIVVAEDGSARRAYFEVVIRLDAPLDRPAEADRSAGLLTGAPAVVRFETPRESLGRAVYRKLVRLIDRIALG